MKIGVLAMQGAFEEHASMFEKLRVETVQVKKLKDLTNLNGLVIPGGESTTIGKLLVEYNMLEPLREKCWKGLPVFGTCAGMVLLSKQVEDSLPGQPVLGVLNVKTRRNAFGRQVDSFEAVVDVPDLGEKPFPGVFIRAPLVESVNNGVEILGRLNEKVVAVRQDNLLATAFHPELTSDLRFHNYFIDIIKAYLKKG